MTSPIQAELAAARLATYLDQCSITEPTDRYAALRRSVAITWLRTLERAALADGIDVWDIIAGIDLLAERTIMQFPTGNGKTQPAGHYLGSTI